MKTPEMPPSGTVAITTNAADSAPHAPPPMKRIALASIAGTTIEWYDFFIFGTAAALVFNKVFFPSLGSTQGTFAALATFGVAFFARPFGAILFGHMGDRIGRKTTLVSTLLLMGFATVAIGLLPAANTAGAWAAVLLVMLRLCQGLAVGGEWAGAVLLTGEYAPSGKRGAFAMFPQLGVAVALALASFTFLMTSLLLTPDQFLSFGWRIPFLSSAVLVFIGLYIRLKIEETPAFRQASKPGPENSVTRIPLFEVFKFQTREVLLAAGAITSGFTCFWIGYTYMTSYATTELNLSRSAVLMVGIVGAFFLAGAIAASATLSDHIGRKPIILVSTLLAIPWSLCLFPIVNMGTTTSFAIGTSVTLVLYGFTYGATGAFLPELFKVRYRYTGAGLAQSLAAILGGAIPPLVATWLVATYGSNAVGLYLAGTALLSALCLIGIRETRNVDIDL